MARDSFIDTIIIVNIANSRSYRPLGLAHHGSETSINPTVELHTISQVQVVNAKNSKRHR